MPSLICPGCKAEISVTEGTQGMQVFACPSCREPLEVEVFPALWRAPHAGRTGDLVTGGEAGCFVHADRRAEAACDACGRFMCALCEVRVGEKHFCIACLEEGRRGGKLLQVERSRTIFAFVAIRIALFGILLGPFAPVAGLSAVTLGAMGLGKPASVTGRRYLGAAFLGIVLGAGVSIPWLFWWASMIAT